MWIDKILQTIAESTCFNRYMVECEWAEVKQRLLSDMGFNRYMVECEFVNDADCFFCIHVLIDTWWNVNYVIEYVV